MITFKELMSKVQSTEGLKLPTRKALLARDERVVEHYINSCTEITVYESGFLVYTRDDYHTVWAVDRCKYLLFCDDVKFYDFQDWEWIHPVSFICEQRLEDNANARENEKIAFYYDESDGEWSLHEEELLSYSDEEDTILDWDEVYSILEPREQMAIKLYYQESLTERQIATEFNISQPAVHKLLNKAIDKLKEYYKA